MVPDLQERCSLRVLLWGAATSLLVPGEGQRWLWGPPRSKAMRPEGRAGEGAGCLGGQEAPLRRRARGTDVVLLLARGRVTEWMPSASLWCPSAWRLPKSFSL